MAEDKKQIFEDTIRNLHPITLPDGRTIYPLTIRPSPDHENVHIVAWWDESKEDTALMAVTQSAWDKWMHEISGVEPPPPPPAPPDPEAMPIPDGQDANDAASTVSDGGPGEDVPA